jgi:hypothetical protein
MYIANKSSSISFLIIGLGLLVLTIFSSTVSAIDLPFDPNQYSFLVYDSMCSETSIVDAMKNILGTAFDPNTDVRTPLSGEEVTLNDLLTHDILIVGWNNNGYTSGINENTLLAGINGRVVLSGHDADWHFLHDESQQSREAAGKFIVNTMDYVLQGGGMGMITLGCGYSFPYLPEEWGITARYETSDIITEFTSEALASGMYDGLDPNDMSGWCISNHNVFTRKPYFVFMDFEKNEEDVVTIARNSTYGLSLEKSDELDPSACVIPYEEITYTIHWSRDNDATGDPNTLYLIDYLPPQVIFDSADPNNGQYDPWNHTYTWNLGTVDPGDSGTVYLTVLVDESAEPLETLTNRAYLTNYEGKLIKAQTETPICCWGGNTIFVDENAVGNNTGVNWQNSYTDLQDALTRAGNDCGCEVWVARGTYAPESGMYDTFTMSDGTQVYGGFVGWEDPNTFDLTDRYILGNKTYLTSDSMFSPVVSISGTDDPNDTILDGFTISGGTSGVSCTNCDDQTTISQCTITDAGTAVSASNSDLNIIDCTIKDSGTGLSIGGYDCSPFIDRCTIYNNTNSGISVNYADPIILNSVIHHNGLDGIYLNNPSSAATIRNNTITDNDGYAVNRNYGSAPDIDNCILWGNNLTGNGYQYYNCFPYNSCYFDPNDPNSGSSTPDINGNITCNPIFAYQNSNPNSEISNYHLDPNSPCIDKGDTNLVGLNELDIDGFERIFEPNVDMGADEVDCEDVYNPSDWYPDGIVNMREFADMSAAWLSCDPNSYDPNLGYTTDNWNPLCDLSDDNVVDMDDLVVFCDDWLWTACWLDTEQMFYSMMSPPSGGESMSLSSSAFSAASLTAEASYTEPVPSCTVEEMTAWLEDIYNDNEEFQLGYSPQEWQEFIDLVRASWPSP